MIIVTGEILMITVTGEIFMIIVTGDHNNKCNLYDHSNW